MTEITKLIEKLPAEAQKKLRSLEYQSEDARILLVDHTTRSYEMQKRITKLEQARDQANDGSAPKKETIALLEEINREHARLVDDRARIAIRLEVLSANANRLGRLKRSIVDWLDAVPWTATLAEHPRSNKSNKSSDVPPDAIEKRRRRIRELIADVGRIDAAPYPSSEAKQRARREIDELAERGRPDVFPLVEHRESIRWPERQLQATGLGARDIPAPDGIALVAWLYRDALIAAVEKEIGESADEAQALTDAQRADRLNTVLADLLAAEREEEELIEAASFSVDRRPDADPRAVLGISSAAPGPSRDLVHHRLIKSVQGLPVSVKPQAEMPNIENQAKRFRPQTS